MKKFLSSIEDGQPKALNTFLTDYLGSELWDAIESPFKNYPYPFIATGVDATGASPNAQITEGIVYMNGKFLRVPATTNLTYPFYIKEAATFNEQTPFFTGGNKDIVSVETAEIDASDPGGVRIEIAEAGGGHRYGDLVWNDFTFINNWANFGTTKCQWAVKEGIVYLRGELDGSAATGTEITDNILPNPNGGVNNVNLLAEKGNSSSGSQRVFINVSTNPSYIGVPVGTTLPIAPETVQLDGLFYFTQDY